MQRTYSLSRYILSITTSNLEYQKIIGANFTLGGTGEIADNFLNSITFSTNGTLYTVKGNARGSYVFDKSLDKTGTVTVNLNQLSEAVARFKQLAEYMYTHDDDSTLTMTLKAGESGEEIVTCTDCLIQSIPGQDFSSTSSDQTWTFVVGRINY